VDTKRTFDLIASLLATILLSPLLALIASLVRLKLGTPILFRQQRPGLRGKPFTIYKFRTMTDARDDRGHLLPDAERLTSLGRFLRSTSLDELPELLNVLTEVRVGCVVRGSLVVVAGCEDHRTDDVQDSQAGGHQPTRTRDNGGILGIGRYGGMVWCRSLGR